ncbi:MAG: threonine synthase, partial [Candidatus Bathyarchaeia archaeon]
MSFASTLRCTCCGETYSLDKAFQACPNCKGTIDVIYDYEKIRERLNPQKLERRGPGVWKYLELLPISDELKIVSLGEGGTFLHKCDRLANELRLKNLFIKDETTNPTGAFIDRGTTVEVSKVKEIGFKSLCCATTGNLGASLAAYSAKAGLNCTVFIPSWVDLGKLYQIIAYGADAEPTENYEEAFSKAVQLIGKSHLVTPGNPFFLEGEKTTGYEICEQFGWKTPDRIIVPMGHGGHISMIWKAIKELFKIGFIAETSVMMTGVQAKGCAPIVEAYEGNEKTIKPVDKTQTFARDLGVKNPLLGYFALQAIRESKGIAISVSDKEIIDATRLLAKTEGIFAEPAATSTVAALRKLLDNGEIDRSERIVCVITGLGLKDPATARRLVERVKEMEKLIKRVEERKLTVKLGRTKLYILEILSTRELYGYGIWKEIKERYNIIIKIPSIYQHLSELEMLGLIKRDKA